MERQSIYESGLSQEDILTPEEELFEDDLDSLLDREENVSLLHACRTRMNTMEGTKRAGFRYLPRPLRRKIRNRLLTAGISFLLAALFAGVYLYGVRSAVSLAAAAVVFGVMNLLALRGCLLVGIHGNYLSFGGRVSDIYLTGLTRITKSKIVKLEGEGKTVVFRASRLCSVQIGQDVTLYLPASAEMVETRWGLSPDTILGIGYDQNRTNDSGNKDQGTLDATEFFA